MSEETARIIGGLSRKDFGEDFLFGAASSAFQIEGGNDVDGRLPSIWDTFLKEEHPDLVKEGALDAINKFYYRYQEDIQIMKEIGLNTFRMSISWPRVLPNGRRRKGLNGEELGVNQLGIDFYNNVINLLLANGIEPHVTLFHWDLPQVLEDEYLGFLDSKIVEDFVDYADLCYREFGDRVKYWMPLNETWSFCTMGYINGTGAPGRGADSDAVRAAMQKALPSNPFNIPSALKRSAKPRQGNPLTEPYIVAHNQLLCHAASVKLYRAKYQTTQKGLIGLGLVAIWAVPHHDTHEDRAAAQRVMDFMLGWIIDPVVFGKYPDSMQQLVGDRLPKFTEEQIKDLVGSYDFFGMNYYTTNSVANNPPTRSTIYNPDSNAICYNYGLETGSTWVYSYPEGLELLLLYTKEKYGNPVIHITENGVDQMEENLSSLWDGLSDIARVTYVIKHLQAVKRAMVRGAKIKGYYLWTAFDNLEWGVGFASRFGMNYINFVGDLERFPKQTSLWYRFFLQN